MSGEKRNPDDYRKSQRLLRAMTERGVRSAAQLAKLMERNESTVRAQINGQNPPSADLFKEAAKTLRINFSWLWYGEGEMLSSQSPPRSVAFLSETDAPDMAVSSEGRYGFSMDEVPERDFRSGMGGGQTPEVIVVQGPGGVTFAAETVSSTWKFPSHFLREEMRLSPSMTDVLRVRGDSMDDGTIHALRDGDRVIIDRSDRALRQGGIFAVSIDGEVIVKQVELLQGSDPPKIVCKSLNKRYGDQVYLLEDEARVMGRVAGAITRR